jgi:hypothetical protein
VKRPGETVKKFAVPVLDIQLTPSALGLVVGQAAIGPPQQEQVEATGSSWQPIDTPPPAQLGAGDVAAAIKTPGTDGPKKRKNSPPGLPPTGLKPRGVAAIVDEPPAGDGPPSITDDQLKKMMAEFNELGIKDKADRLAFIAAAVRPVASSRDLTVAEASKVIDQLVRVNAGEMTMVWNDNATITLTMVGAS